ncbi:hypothetical protein BDV59DRAFT_104846 [Aspergillus ambiguus]|uniref:uncharacterized protein n=1 Tax=Aspergillus ambiguus TaxID=176160 RepID=UPI003CCD0FF8
MHMPLRTVSRATLFHLILSPLVSTPLRASPTASALKSPSLRASSIFYPQCSSAHLYQQGPLHPYTTMSPNNQGHPAADSPATDNAHPEQPAPHEREQPYLALPDADSADQTTQLDVSAGGSTVKLDHLGPLVVNQDGTLSRIANWEQMTEIEKKNTLRVLGKRNKQRMEALKAAGVGQDEEGK